MSNNIIGFDGNNSNGKVDIGSIEEPIVVSSRDNDDELDLFGSKTYEEALDDIRRDEEPDDVRNDRVLGSIHRSRSKQKGMKWFYYGAGMMPFHSNERYMYGDGVNKLLLDYRSV